MVASGTTRVRLPARYRPLRHIASGGMATVWAAEDTVLGRTVAIKLLGAHFAGDGRAVRRFQREARAAATLSAHPHVVTIYDVGEYEGRPFIVMEHMAGGSLADVLRRGRPPRERALRWLAEAAEALDAAHGRGIVHRDVKPHNLLLDERGRLAVADFGIARVAQQADLTMTGEVLGSAAYIAPEQARGSAASAAADRYALAVVAYELLTGTRPFAAEGPAALAHAHASAAPPPPSTRAGDLPPEVDRAILRGLSKDPSHRWPRAAALSDAVAFALDGAAATAATRRLGDASTAATAALAPAAAPAAAASAGAAEAPIRLPRPRRSGATPPRVVLALVVLGALALGGALASAAGTSTVDPRVVGAARLGSPPTAAPTQPAVSTPPSTATTAPPPAPAAGPPPKDQGKHGKHGGKHGKGPSDGNAGDGGD